MTPESHSNFPGITTDYKNQDWKSRPVLFPFDFAQHPASRPGLINSLDGAEASSRQERVSLPDSPLLFLLFLCSLSSMLVLKIGTGSLSKKVDADGT